MKNLLKSGMGVLAAAWMMQTVGVFAQQPPTPPAQAGQAAGQPPAAGQPAAGRQGGGRGGGGGRTNPPVPLEDRTGFTPMFDGTSLKGWDGDPTFWRVENGTIVGESTAEKAVAENTFLIYTAAEPANFELKFEFKMNSTNSGVQYRSKRLTGAVNKWAMCGYQADFDFINQYTGMLYEERGRPGPFLAPRGTINYAPPNPDKIVHGPCTVNAPVVARAGGAGGRGQGGAAGAAGGGGRAAGAAPPAAGAPVTPPPPPPPAPPARQQIGQLEDGEAMKQYVKVNDWNTFHVIARGNTLIHILNGKVTAIFIDDDETNRSLKGSIGIQIHTGPPMKLELRNLGLKVLP